MYDRAGNLLSSFATASSPEAISMSYNQTTGILSFSNEEKEGFSICPNPATNQFSIDADLTIKTSVQILNYNGQLVKEVHQLKHSNQIDISDLNSGIYFVNVLINDSFLTEKLIIR